MAQALVGGGAPFTPGEMATIAVARSLARIPCELTSSERNELSRCYGEKQAEWIVLGAVMMGFLNKFMNTIGVELEPSIVADVSTVMGPDWSPGKAGADLDPSALRIRHPLRTASGLSCASSLCSRQRSDLTSAGRTGSPMPGRR